MTLRSFLHVFTAVAGLVAPLFAEIKPKGPGEPAINPSLFIGQWSAGMVLPNGISLLDHQTIRSDGFATGRLVTLYRDGTIKSICHYSFAWRVEGRILISDSIVRVPPRSDLPDSSRDEIVRLDETEFVIRDLANNIVVTYKRVP